MHSNSQQCSHLHDQKLQEPFNFIMEGEENKKTVIFLELLTLAPGLEFNTETEKHQYNMQGQKQTLTACLSLAEITRHPSMQVLNICLEKQSCMRRQLVQMTEQVPKESPQSTVNTSNRDITCKPYAYSVDACH